MGEVEREVDPDGWVAPVTWRDLTADPLAVVAQPAAGELPSDVYQVLGLLAKASKTPSKPRDFGNRSVLGSITRSPCAYRANPGVWTVLRRR